MVDKTLIEPPQQRLKRKEQKRPWWLRPAKLIRWALIIVSLIDRLLRLFGSIFNE